jgi:hypothetical protein
VVRTRGATAHLSSASLVNVLFAAASELQRFLAVQGWRWSIIGGAAVGRAAADS